MRVDRGNLGPMLTFWKAEGVPQWTVLVMSVVPSLWRRESTCLALLTPMGRDHGHMLSVCFPLGFEQQGWVGVR